MGAAILNAPLATTAAQAADILAFVRTPPRGRNHVMMRLIVARLLVVLCFFLEFLGQGRGRAEESPHAGELKLATFQCDVTPPVNGRHPLIWLVPVKEVETPLEARGVVLDDGKSRYVLCAVDWCGLCNSSYRQFQEKIASALGIPPSHVAVQTVHQHTAPYTNGDVQKILDQSGATLPYVDFAFMEAVTDKLATEVKSATERLKPFNEVGFGSAVVEQVASNRRAWTPEGKLVVRYSSCKDPQIRALPEGLIDPYVRTVTFARDGKPLVRLHYYATHPQSFYGDPRASADVPGFARRQLEQEENVMQIYFTGCAGNITMGKYNDGTREARDQLTERLYRAMSKACKNTRYEPVRSLNWRVASFCFIPRSDSGYSESELQARVNQRDLDPVQRIRAAEGLAFLARAQQPFLAQLLEINEGAILHLPGECFVEYQLYAQSVRPNRFVAVAAYGDLAPGYICTAKAYEEGGYEPSATFLDPRNEEMLKNVIAKLLQN
jgi:hypothetical protein